MENIYINDGNGQGYGWILYRTRLTKTTAPLGISGIHDRAQVIFNDQYIGTYEFQQKPHYLKLPTKIAKPKENILDIFVENMGRVNWDKEINSQRKGLLCNVTLAGAALESWAHIPFEFCDKFKATCVSVISSFCFQ